MSTSPAPFLLLLLLLAAAAGKPASSTSTELVDKICKQTSSYSLCVETLCEDPRTTDATELRPMAQISVDLAYIKADRALECIKGRAGSGSGLLKRCESEYGTAVAVLARALNDLNSDTYHELADDASDTKNAVEDCQKTAESPTWKPLEDANRVLVVLCEVIEFIGNSLTGLM